MAADVSSFDPLKQFNTEVASQRNASVIEARAVKQLRVTVKASVSLNKPTIDTEVTKMRTSFSQVYIKKHCEIIA